MGGLKALAISQVLIAYSGEREHLFSPHWVSCLFTSSVHDQSIIDCTFRMDSPFNLIRWALRMSRSRIASASVLSPID